MIIIRGCGILAHISSLPSDHGIGDIGRGARMFVDFLHAGRQRYWQFLPVGPTSQVFDNSPYMSSSAFAGNPLLICMRSLAEDGFLGKRDLGDLPVCSEYFVEFHKVIPLKMRLLSLAFEFFQKDGRLFSAFEEFCAGEKKWLDDYALFVSLKELHNQQPWYAWPRPLAVRSPAALNRAALKLADKVMLHKFIQFCFYSQWHSMCAYARDKGVVLIGDMPIYVGLDSADVWAHQDIFKLDKDSLLPTHVSGVPPDYFSPTGQRWGTPVYRWADNRGRENRSLYDWWEDRFRHTFRTVDMVRVDHFRGFESYWEIPAEEETAVLGQWVKGPGLALFKRLAKVFPDLPIIAEDLGLITPAVEELRDIMRFPGMKVLQFAFDSDSANVYLPYNYTDPNCVVYTGTHDNDTTVGWYFSPQVSQKSKDNALRYANSRDGSQIHKDFMRMAYSSVAERAIIPLQDILGFGGDCRMNVPSTMQGNWGWRCASRFLTNDLSRWLGDEALFYGRLAPPVLRQGIKQRKGSSND